MDTKDLEVDLKDSILLLTAVDHIMASLPIKTLGQNNDKWDDIRRIVRLHEKLTEIKQDLTVY